MKRYRKRPVIVEAVQWNGVTGETAVVDLQSWGCQVQPAADWSQHYALVIPTLDGDMKCSVGDWIIKGIKGEFYPCKPDIFDATYEAVEE